MSDGKVIANVYIDGNFTFHIHSYLVKKYKKIINWEMLLNFIKDKIIASNPSIQFCKIEAQCFLGTDYVSNNKSRDFLTNSMNMAGITHRTTLLKKLDNAGFKEDAVDTNLVFFATKDYYAAKDDKYDYLVLLAGDSDFVPLIENLKKEGVKIFVLYIDFEEQSLGLGRTRTAQNLLESSNMRENIQHLIDERVDEKIKSIKISNSIKYILLQEASTPVSRPVQFSEPYDSDESLNWPEVESAIKKVQADKCSGRNDFVLVNQVGEKLFTLSHRPRHGSLLRTIMFSFRNRIEIDDSNPNAKKVRIKTME